MQARTKDTFQRVGEFFWHSFFPHPQFSSHSFSLFFSYPLPFFLLYPILHFVQSVGGCGCVFKLVFTHTHRSADPPTPNHVSFHLLTLALKNTYPHPNIFPFSSYIPSFLLHTTSKQIRKLSLRELSPTHE